MVHGVETATRPAVTGYDDPSSAWRPPAAPKPAWLRALIGAPGALVAVLSLAAVFRATPFPDDGAPAELADAGAKDDAERADDAERVEARPEASAQVAAGTAKPRASEPETPQVLRDTAEVRAAQEAFSHKLRINDLKGSVVALQKLLDVQPDAPKDPAVRDRVVDLAVRIMFVQGNEPDVVFTLIATKMGKPGIDILYQIATTKGGSKAQKYAEALLDDARILDERGSEAVKIAWKLYRTTDCAKKKSLLAQAGEHGDRRSLGQLQLMDDSCKARRRMPNACCFAKDPELEAALAALKARGIQ
jgi:hypothetical protein